MPSNRVDFKHVREHASFEAVATHYDLAVIGKGDQKTALCCFHQEDSPSLKINVAKKLFNCFGCGKHGNVLDFVTYMEGGDPSKDADLRKGAFKLAEICGIAPLPNAPALASKADTRAKLKVAPPQQAEPTKPELSAKEARVNRPLKFNLKLDAKHDYIAERNLSQFAIETFGLGVADRGMMKDRLAIPIHNENGELIAYAGRYARGDVPKGISKYLLPEGFSKQTVLFNFHRLMLHADGRKRKRVFLVESYFSVFKLHELGLPVVSPMGHSVSEEQCETLASIGVDEVILLFDGDEAGAQGLCESLPLLAQYFYVHAPVVPVGFKPHKASDEEINDLSVS